MHEQEDGYVESDGGAGAGRSDRPEGQVHLEGHGDLHGARAADVGDGVVRQVREEHGDPHADRKNDRDEEQTMN